MHTHTHTRPRHALQEQVEAARRKAKAWPGTHATGDRAIKSTRREWQASVSGSWVSWGSGSVSEREVLSCAAVAFKH